MWCWRIEPLDIDHYLGDNICETTLDCENHFVKESVSPVAWGCVRGVKHSQLRCNGFSFQCFSLTIEWITFWRGPLVAQRNLPRTTPADENTAGLCYSYTKEYGGVLDHAKASAEPPLGPRVPPHLKQSHNRKRTHPTAVTNDNDFHQGLTRRGGGCFNRSII